MMQAPASCTSEMKDLVMNHPMWQHEFLIRCRNQQLTLAEVTVLATQMYIFCKEFNRFLANIYLCCPDEQVKLVILDNLFDEMGRGDPAQVHAELFRRFTRQLGINDSELESIPPRPNTQALIDTYLSMPQKYGYLAALSVICFASEGIVGALYEQIQNGIATTAHFPKESLVFFDMHIVVDSDHADRLESILTQKMTAPDIEKSKLAIQEAMNARLGFLDDILTAGKL